VRSWPARPLAWHRRVRVKLLQLLAGRDGVILNVRLPPYTSLGRDTPVLGGALFVIGCHVDPPAPEKRPGCPAAGRRRGWWLAPRDR
jgi:hypothetical protein